MKIAILAATLWAVTVLAMSGTGQLPLALNPAPPVLPQNQQALLDEFRRYYRRLETATYELVASGADSVVLERLGDQLDMYRQILNEVCYRCSPESH